jgi:hypothetical protein
VVSGSQVTAVSPAQAASVRYVVVTTPGGSNPLTVGVDQFTYKAPRPVVTNVAPTSGPPTGGTAVTITGSGFTGATKVFFGPVAATSFTVVSGSQVTAVSPAQAASVRYVVVTTPGGSNPLTVGVDQFTYKGLLS